MKFKFNFRGKRILMKVEKCESFWSQLRGLMFRRNPSPLLFILNKPSKFSIHSFFCKPFVAIWLLNNKVVDAKIVQPWTFRVWSKNPADKLLEIPFSSEKKIYDFPSVVRKI